MQKITPSLWFDKNCEEAMNFYVSVFEGSPAKRFDSRIVMIKRYPEGITEGPMQGMGGKVLTGIFELEGRRFMALDGGPIFKFNESVSFQVECKDQEEVDYLWGKLSAVPASDLPAPRPGIFYVYIVLCNDESKYIGQTQDLIKRWNEHTNGNGAEHTRKYGVDKIIHYEEFTSREEAVKREHNLKTGFGRKWIQREWKAGRLRQAGQCGWLKDKYGLSWQITPKVLGEMLTDKDEEKAGRVLQAMLAMKKIDIEGLKKAAAD